MRRSYSAAGTFSLSLSRLDIEKPPGDIHRWRRTNLVVTGLWLLAFVQSPARPSRCLHCVRHRQVPHRLRRLNLGRLAGLRLHPSRVARQGALLLLREMSSVASPAQGFQRPTGGRVARSHLQGMPSRFLSPSPKAGSRASSCAPGDGRCARPWPTPVGFRQPRPASFPW